MLVIPAVPEKIAGRRASGPKIVPSFVSTSAFAPATEPLAIPSAVRKEKTGKGNRSACVSDGDKAGVGATPLFSE